MSLVRLQVCILSLFVTVDALTQVQQHILASSYSEQISICDEMLILEVPNDNKDFCIFQ